MEFLEIIILPLIKKIEQDPHSQKELSNLLKDIWEEVKQKPGNFELRELLTQICSVEDTIDSIIARKMLQRQNISIRKAPVKYFSIAKGSVKFPHELHKQTKGLKKILNDFLSAPVPEEKLPSKSDTVEVPAKESSSNTVPQKKSSKDAAVLSRKPSISGGIQVSSENKDVGRDNKDSDERHHQSWEEGCVPIFLEELVSKLAQPALLSRRVRQLLILKANLKYPSDAIFLWTSYHSSVTKQHFQFCCWVRVSKESGERNILSDILKQVPSIKQGELELSNQLLRKRLQDFLVFERYLIVLYGELRDDVWNSLKSAFPYSLNGSRVLLICKGITSTNVSREWSSQQLGKSKDYLLEESRMIGMKDIMTELYQSILNQYKLLFLISIVGVAESEKTTFLWAMYNAEDIKQQFQYRAWVLVPKEFKETDLLADILEQVTDNKVEEEDLDLVTLQKKLCNFLAPKRYLIVLYDVWTTEVWDKLKQAFPNSMNGSRVIITVHEADVARQTNSSWILGTVCGKESQHEKVSNLKVKHRWGRLSDVKANESGLVGLDDKVQELAELLLENYQFLISVVGVAGSGKTILVKAIYSSLAIKQHFECRAFVSVSQVFEERKLLADLSMQLGMVRKDESWSKEELQKRLRSFLGWKRYLIVLDDVYTAGVWEKLSLAFPNSSNGSRVILTTRDACVPRNIKGHTRVIQLRFLNNDESWELFVKRVPTVVENAELIKAVKEKILQRCGGLPLDIVVLGGLLSTKELKIPVWSKFIEQVSQKKEKKGRITGEDGVNSSGQPASSHMKKANGGQSYSFTKRDSSDTKLEEKDDKGEIEEIGPSEASRMQKEEKVKHGATKEDQEPSPNQLPSSSDTTQKEDNRILAMQNTSFDQDQAGSSDETLSGILALGYQDLNSQLKFCLNYLGLFPKSYKVPFRRLIQLLQAEGLLKQETKEESFEEQVKKYIEDLKKRNMIEVEEKLNGSPKTICMKSTLYDALSPRAEKAGLFHIHFNHEKKDAPKQFEYVRRLAEHPEISYDRLPNYSFSLRSYVSFKTEKGDRPAFGVDKFLKDTVKRGFGLIVILDLEGFYKPVLSKHLGKFPNLKYLGLRWTFLDSIPNSVGDLPCLETLDVKHTNISTLPGEFWEAKYLQYLYMNNICVDTSIPKAPQTNGSLTNLKTLLGLVIRSKDSVAYLKAANGLRKLGVTCHEESIKETVEWISKLTQLQSLKLRSINKSHKSSTLKFGDLGNHTDLSQLYLIGQLEKALDVKKFPPKLEILTLAVSELPDDPMKELGKMESLKILGLHARSYKGRTMTCLRDTFPKLQVLKLWMLEELEKWEVEKGAMPALEEVEIRCCKKLINTDGLKELTTLKELILTGMNQDFVKELKERLGRLGSNVSLRENDWKFSSTWAKAWFKWNQQHSIYKWKSSSWSDLMGFSGDEYLHNEFMLVSQKQGSRHALA
ncbi:hypothetical protein SLEP1_g30379 [Rubroshorea leprosula]|uniref:Uncharacterized protein n=1 Tax=Rubroshorea leprosula TaxID=152421 RepID=A0AAV5K620_9ROSI|nr:hypothetical protein SLEP1_g30379 [Rubroshorea leprosula]